MEPGYVGAIIGTIISVIGLIIVFVRYKKGKQ